MKDKVKVPDDFAKWDADYGTPHHCIALGKGNAVISVKTPNGKKITFSFLSNDDKTGHQCVDVVQHREEKTKQGNSPQRVSLYTEGSTRIRTTVDDAEPVTITAILLD